MSDQNIRVAVVGCGGMARKWVAEAIAHPGIELVGLVDLDREAARAMAERYELPQTLAFDSLADAVRAAQPDAVFDVTVPAAHDKVTIEALGLGCHVLGEKPMSDTLAKARAMVAAAKAAGKTYAVTQTRRPAGFAQRSVGMIRSGAIGDVQEAHADFYIGARFGAGERSGDFRGQMDYPLILDMSIHTFDTARQLTGADPVRVYCHSWNPRRSWYKGDASAHCVFDMKLPNGDPVVFTYRGSWTNEGCQTNWNADWRIVGQRGTLHTDGGAVVEAEVVRNESDPGFFRELEKASAPPFEGETDGHRVQIRDFIDAIRTGRKPMCDCEDNIKSLAMVLAAVESAKAGRPVDVAW